MKRSIFVLSISLLIPFFPSCNISGFDLRVDTVKAGDEFDGLWLLSYSKNVYAVDPEDLAVRIHFSLNTFVSQPVLDTYGNILIGDQGKKVGAFGNGLYVLNSQGTVLRYVPALPNISNIAPTESFIFTDSMCFYDDGYCGFSLIDRNNAYAVTTNMTMSNYVVHSGRQWIHNNQLYVGTAEFPSQSRPASFFTIDCLSGNVSLPFTDFTSQEEGDQRQFFYTLDSNSLYTLYGYEKTIRRFDLDSKSLAAFKDLESDLVEMVPDLEHCVIQYPVCFADDLYILCTATNGNLNLSLQGLVILDPETLVFKKFLPLEYITTSVLLPPFSFFDEYPNFVYFRYYNRLLKYDLATGKIDTHTSLE